MSSSEKKMNKNTYDISSIKRVTRKFLEVSRFSRTKQRQRNVQKSVLPCKVAFLPVRPIAVFSPFSFPSPLSITRLYILFEQTINIIESFAFSPVSKYNFMLRRPLRYDPYSSVEANLHVIAYRFCLSGWRKGQNENQAGLFVWLVTSLLYKSGSA